MSFTRLLNRIILTYTLLFRGLEVIAHSSYAAILGQTIQKVNTNEDNQSVFLRDNGTVVQKRTSTTYTVGNTLCRSDNECGFNQGTSYIWCYTEDTWNYCCGTPCQVFGSLGQMRCESGTHITPCSNTKEHHTTKLVPCIDTHPCGTHENLGSQ
ncbi:hypothetical protein CHS0354_000330 [Potamilus streckersoni]|uniref:Uncharacterized protein n=1 Tax=Potamilus streckersoni TaxID=2493646 RepID=A0AAE0SEB1_9BIVA|nr:hypothetical protein CHS0354_000330 [Potamilus streckersoni]